MALFDTVEYRGLLGLLFASFLSVTAIGAMGLSVVSEQVPQSATGLERLTVMWSELAGLLPPWLITVAFAVVVFVLLMFAKILDQAISNKL